MYHMIYMATYQKISPAGAFASRGESSRSRARFQNPVKLSKFRSSKFGIKSQKFLGTWDPEFWVLQPTDVLKCAGDIELLMRPLKMKVVFFTPILEAQTAVDLSPVHKADWHLTKILSRPPSLRTSTCTPVSRRGAWPPRCRARRRQNWNPCSTGGK